MKHDPEKHNKFTQGKQIRSLTQLFALLDAEKWVYLNGVPKHPQWVLNMTIRRLGIAVEDGELQEAKPNPKKQARRRRKAA